MIPEYQEVVKTLKNKMVKLQRGYSNKYICDAIQKLPKRITNKEIEECIDRGIQIALDTFDNVRGFSFDEWCEAKIHSSIQVKIKELKTPTKKTKYKSRKKLRSVILAEKLAKNIDCPKSGVKYVVTDKYDLEDDDIENVIFRHYIRILQECDWNKYSAADRLKVAWKTIYNRLNMWEKLGYLKLA